MTGEEKLAEEYICNGKCQDDITRNYVHCKNCTRLDDFIAGYKAGRPKWHKVADGDLPSEEGGWVCNQNGLPCFFFDWGTEQWLDCEGTQIRTTEWCYMPHKE